MQNPIKLRLLCAAFFTLFILIVIQGCEKDNELTPMSGELKKSHPANNYQVVNLVSDVEEYDAQIIDTNLVNAWGIAFGPTGGIWISSTEKGVSVIYDKTGATLRPPVVIPSESGPTGGEPTGQVFNSTTAFVIPSTGALSRFIFATENGTIAAWASGNSAVTVADRSAQGAIYKGLELASDGGAWYLYATDFYNGHVDVFDENFDYVTTKPFSDPTIPAGFAPFNICKMGQYLFVTYAKQEAPDNEDDEPGAGNGYVNIFKTDGSFVKRFVSQGTLNSPWGLAVLKMGNGFGMPAEDELADTSETHILIGNFGDGRINEYDMNGTLIGSLQSNGEPIEIEGLWAISYAPQHNFSYKNDRSRLYFTAGPDDEEHGLFGYISR